ncbi:MAG: hypothetical protein PVH19_03195 [Planctomycetia bacterium]
MNWIFATLIWIFKLTRWCRSQAIVAMVVVAETVRRVNPFVGKTESFLSVLRQVRSGFMQCFDVGRVRVGLKLLLKGEIRENTLCRAYVPIPVRRNGRSPARPSPDDSGSSNQHPLGLGRSSTGWDHPLD